MLSNAINALSKSKTECVVFNGHPVQCPWTPCPLTPCPWKPCPDQSNNRFQINKELHYADKLLNSITGNCKSAIRIPLWKKKNLHVHMCDVSVIGWISWRYIENNSSIDLLSGGQGMKPLPVQCRPFSSRCVSVLLRKSCTVSWLSAKEIRIQQKISCITLQSLQYTPIGKESIKTLILIKLRFPAQPKSYTIVNY